MIWMRCHNIQETDCAVGNHAAPDLIAQNLTARSFDFRRAYFLWRADSPVERIWGNNSVWVQHCQACRHPTGQQGMGADARLNGCWWRRCGSIIPRGGGNYSMNTFSKRHRHPAAGNDTRQWVKTCVNGRAFGLSMAAASPHPYEEATYNEEGRVYTALGYSDGPPVLSITPMSTQDDCSA